MDYQPGHDYFLRAIASTAVISNTTGAISNAPAITSAADVGYLSPNAVVIDDGTQPGYASGSEDALYHKRGWRTAMLSADIRMGSVAFIKDACLAGGGALPYYDLFYGISARWARAIYKAKCSRLALSFPMSDAAELTASATFEGQAYAPATAITLGYDYEEFGPALLSTDVRSFAIGAQDLLQNVMALSVEIDRGVERKNGRREFGHDVPGSRTAYDIITHHRSVPGTIQLHDLPSIESALFYADGTAMDWSDLVVTVNDIAEQQIYDLTIHNPRPAQRAQQQIESAGQMNWNVPFVASAISIATSRA